MKNKDMQIISFLRQDSRMPLSAMSRKTGIPVSTIFDRLRQNGGDMIVKNTCLLDFLKMGFSVRTQTMLKVKNEDKAALREFLKGHEKVNSAYKINNGFDFMLEGVFRDIIEMEEFLELLKSRFRIDDHKSFFIIEDLKREEFLSNPLLL